MSFLGMNGGGFMGGSSFGGGGMNPLYGGGMMGGGYGGYGGGGMHGQGMQQQQPQIDPATGQPIQPPEGYQFDFRRDLQATVGGLNASLGLAYGMTQMASLSVTGFKLYELPLFTELCFYSVVKAAKYVLLKIFNMNNILGPIKFLLRVLFGLKFDKTPQNNNFNPEDLEKLWNSSQPQRPSPLSILPKKILGMSGALLKSVIFAVVGLSLQFVLFLVKRRKTRKLEEIKKQEEIEAQERQREMESQWKMALEQDQNQKPEFLLSKNGSIGPLVEVTALEDGDQDDMAMFGINSDDKIGVTATAYDGELNPMTFNHVKSSSAFASHKRHRLSHHLSMIDEEMHDRSSENDETDFNKWLAKSQQLKGVITKKSEDGWGSHRLARAMSQQYQRHSSANQQ